ncbi:MAG: hypothetical protein U0V70_03030 [Terriglobia bacterium]
MKTRSLFNLDGDADEATILAHVSFNVENVGERIGVKIIAGQRGSGFSISGETLLATPTPFTLLI